MARNFLSVDDLSSSELAEVLELSAKVKASPSDYAGRLAGLSVAMIFEKPSTRTRVSFEVAIAELGAHPLALSSTELQLGRGETIEDTGRVLSRYVDAIVLRTFGQERLEALARTASVPIVNALSDFEHPCQCLADLLTVGEKKGRLARITLAYVGDGNNVAHSLLLGGAKAGMNVRVATPFGYEPIPQVVGRAEEIGRETGGSAMITHDPVQATVGADVLYTDVWASMGQEDEQKQRERAFRTFTVSAALMKKADKSAIFLHCLPAHRGEEVSADVIDGPQSRVWDEAENRLHMQKAIMAALIGREKIS
jgi:ornithine carbamoyltransferase